MATTPLSVTIDVRGMPELMRQIKLLVVEALSAESWTLSHEAGDAVRRVAARIEAAMEETAVNLEKAKD